MVEKDHLESDFYQDWESEYEIHNCVCSIPCK